MARGTFQGNLQGTPSRPLEMLTSSKAVTASYAETASRLGVGKVGDSGNPVYFNNGIPVADSKTKGIVDWVTNNSGSISGVTGSSADVAVRVNNLEGKSGSWDSSSKWVGDNSASLLNPATLIISKSLGVPSAGNISYNPFKSASITIAVPSTPGHIGAAPANHTHSTSQVNSLDAFTASVKSDLAEISGKTGSYAPKDDYLPIGGGTITGSLVINNDLTVKGTTVSIDAQNLNVKDKLILVASGSNTRAAANGAGIAVPTASAGEGGAARIQYDGTANVFTSSVGFKAPSFTGSLRGNVTGTASFATSASRAVSAASADTATSASEATHAVSASEAVHAITASHAVNAKTALTASYLENGASIVVNTASYAKIASVAQKVAWTAVDGRPSFYTASFVAGAFSGVQFNPTGGFAQVKVPSTTTHISGLDAVTASVKQMVAKSASWDNVANTASAAYAAASQALATASVAQKEAESASYWKTEASKSAASASTFKTTAQTAATQANAASQSAKNAASAANTASGSAKTAATVATNWSLSASNAANIANAASASAQSASNAANVASQSAKTAATVAQGWVTSASKAAQDAEEYRDTASGSMEDARFYSSQAATNATLSSTYAVQSSASAQLAAASASAAASSATNAATYATRAQQSASNAHTSKNLAAASASAAATYATQASQSAYTAAQAVIPATTAANAASASAKNSAASASASAALLYKNLGSKTQPIYLTTGGPALCDPYSSASVKSASYALVAESVKDGAGLTVDKATKLIGTSGSTSLPVWVNAGVPTAITKLAGIPVTASTLRATSNLDVAGNAVINGDLTVKGTTTAIDATHLNVKDTLILLASGSTTQAAANGAGIAIQTASATTQAAREGAAARFQYRSSDNKFTASVGIVAPSFTGNLTGTSSYATKATSADSATVATGLGVAGNTSASVAAAIAAKWTYNENTIKAVKVNSASRADSAATAGSATTATTASYNKAGAEALAWITANSASATTNTDRYVNTAAFASTGSNGANGVKMTLTRAGSDTAQVTAVIPVASATAAGVVTGAQLKSWTSGSSWVGANSASIATAVTNNHTHSNKAVLDGISAADTASWDGKWTYNEATIKAVKVTSASRADSAASATSASHVPFATFAQTNGVYLTASVGNTTKTAAINSASRAVSAASADVATLAKSASLLVATANADRPVLFTEGSGTANGNGDFLVSSNITFNPSTKVLKATNISATNVTASTGFRGNLTGTASYATVAGQVGGEVNSEQVVWGGPNQVGTYQPIDAALVSNLSANRFAFMQHLSASFYHSTNGGTSWNLINLTESQKSDFFNGNGFSVRANQTQATSSANPNAQLMVSVKTAGHIYTVINKFLIYLSTQGDASCWCTVRGRLQSNLESNADTWNYFVTSQSVSGWSGWNVINTSIVTYGNTKTSQYGEIQFIFGHSGTSTTTYSGLQVSNILAFGGMGWTVPSTLARTGHLYSWDGYQNATFPKAVTASSGFKGNLIGNVTGTSSYATTAGSVTGISAASITASTAAAITALVTASGSKWSTDTDRYVATASFASTGPKGANGVKMTLTRRGSDTGTVVATIPVASTSAAGVVTGTQVTSWNGAATNSHTHSNKAVLDGISAADTASWDAKQAAISDLATIRSNATNGNTALTWITANSSSALTKYHPLSGSVGTPLVAQNVTSANEFLITGAASVNHYYRVNGSQHQFGFGIGTGNTNRGIFQFSTGSGGTSKTGWLLLWDNTYTASFLAGYRVKADGFIGSLQGNVTGTSSWANNAVSATSASMLQSNRISNPNSASVSHSAVKWFANLAQTSGYAGTNYGFPTTNNANGILWLGTHPGYYGHQLGFSSTGRIYDRYISAGSFPTTANGGSWKTILTSDDTGSWATAAANSHTHSNKALLDSLTNAKTGSWDGKWTYSEATIKAVKVNSASRADSAASATTATKLVGTSGSTSIPVYINAGVPTVCAGTVVSTADRNTWTTASHRAQAADDGLTTPLYGNQGEQTNTVYRGAFKIIDASVGHVEIDLADDEVPDTPSSPETAYGAGVKTKLSIWGGLILNVAGTVEFVSDTGASFIWSENSVDVEAGGTYEFNCIQYENGGDIYGIITKYSES